MTAAQTGLLRDSPGILGGPGKGPWEGKGGLAGAAKG